MMMRLLLACVVLGCPFVLSADCHAADWLTEALGKDKTLRLSTRGESAADQFQFTCRFYFDWKGERRFYQLLVEGKSPDAYAMLLLTDRGTCAGFLMPDGALLLDRLQPGRLILVEKIACNFSIDTQRLLSVGGLAVTDRAKLPHVTLDLGDILNTVPSHAWNTNDVSHSASAPAGEELRVELRKSHGIEFNQYPLAGILVTKGDKPKARIDGLVVGADPDVSLLEIAFGDWESVAAILSRVDGAPDLPQLQGFFATEFLATLDDDPLHREAAGRLRGAILPRVSPPDEELAEVDAAIRELASVDNGPAADKAIKTLFQNITIRVYLPLFQFRRGDNVIVTDSYDRSRAANLLPIVYGHERAVRLVDCLHQVVANEKIEQLTRMRVAGHLARLGLRGEEIDSLGNQPSVKENPDLLSLLAGARLMNGSGNEDDVRLLVDRWDDAVKRSDADDADFLIPLLWTGQTAGIEERIRAKLDDAKATQTQLAHYSRYAAASPEGQRILADLLQTSYNPPLQESIVAALQGHVHEIPERDEVRAWAEKGAFRFGNKQSFRASAALLAASLGSPPELFERFLAEAVRAGDPQLLVELPRFTHYYEWSDALLPHFEAGLASDSANVRALALLAMGRMLPEKLDESQVATTVAIVDRALDDEGMVAFSTAPALLRLQAAGHSIDERIETLLTRFEKTDDPRAMAMAVLLFAELRTHYRAPVSQANHAIWASEAMLNQVSREKASLIAKLRQWHSEKQAKDRQE